MAASRIKLAMALCVSAVLAAAIVPGARGNHSTTDLVSTGQINGNGAHSAGVPGVSADGTRAFFVTTEQLVSADTDGAADVYERSGGATTLISTGPNGGNAEIDASFSAATPDGSRVFFTTAESLVAADADSGCIDPVDLTPRPCEDVYERSANTTTLVSAGGNGAFDASYEDSSSDGARVFFTTNEPLVAGDTDAGCSDPPEPGTRRCRDVYERSSGTTTLVSTGGNGAFDAFYAGSSSNGSVVLFSTAEGLLGGDTDSFEDVYQRTGAATMLLSTGPAGGNGAFDAFYAGSSADAGRVFIATSEALVSGDTDGHVDVYELTGGTTTLISTGPTGGNGAFEAGLSTVSSDGGTVHFITYEKLVSADTDSSLDIYRRTGGTTALVSTGPSGGNGVFDVFYRGATPGGTHVYFTTAEKLVAADTDSSQDVYEHSSGTTVQVSAGQINGNGSYSVAFRGVSNDGSRVFFTTRERLVSTDSDPAPGSCVGTTCSQDVYERFGGTTYLVSLGPTGDTGTLNANYGGASSDGLRVFYTTAKQQVTADTDSSTDVYLASVPQAGYPRPKGATPTSISLVPASAACTSPDRQHGPPLAYPSCNPPDQASPYLTVGTPDANGRAASSVGRVKITAVLGNPSTPADEADANYTVSMTDVRNTGALTDYAGELKVEHTVRMTDRLSGSIPQDPATVQDFTFQFTVPCGVTSDPAIGSDCSSVTSIDAVVPGAIVELKRTMWQLGEIRVTDGGADGVAATTPNSVFAVPGIFVP